jgi:hypothetical protein
MTECPHLTLDANFKKALLTPVGTDDGWAEENLLNATEEIITDAGYLTEEVCREEGNWQFPSIHDVLTAALLTATSKADFMTWVSTLWDLNRAEMTDDWPACCLALIDKAD